ncbi:MAG TPA: MGMT family protein [Pseudonocardiaceae bacterium]|nr:MGMT family protein [Pseudonocardiaceae bacterium]
MTGFALFDTAIGRCGIGWTASAIAAVQLPEPTEDRTRARLRRRLPGPTESAPTPLALDAIERIIALLADGRAELRDIPLDMSGLPAFDQRVYRAAQTIPAGRTITYGGIASMIGSPGSAREVGRALGRNPFAIVVPCHRVVAAGGRTGGFSATGGVRTKLALLAAESR